MSTAKTESGDDGPQTKELWRRTDEEIGWLKDARVSRNEAST